MKGKFVRSLGVVSVSALALALLGSPAQAAGEVSVGAVEDTFVTSANPTANWATSPNARLDDSPKLGLFKFNVANVPAGATVASATLSLTGVGTQTAQSVDVYSVANSWTQDTNYNNRPALGTKLASASVASGQTTSFNVTSAVNGNGTVSFAVTRSTAGDDNVVATSENGTAANRPSLTVTYNTVAAKTNLRPSLPGAVGDNTMVNITAGDVVTFNGDWYVEDANNTLGERIEWYIDGVWVTNRAYTPQPIGAYGSTSQGTWTATEGQHTVKMVIDPLNEVDENNETDNESTRTFTVAPKVVTPTNAAPTVDAGANASATRPAAANLNGTVSDDGLPSGSSVSTTWAKVSGPGTVTFGSASAVDTTATFSAAGTYILKLTATDGSLSASDQVTITVADQVVTPSSDLPYTADSFFKSKVTNAPVDAGLTASFQSFMAQHEEQGGKGITWPKVNLNPGWSGHNWVGKSTDPVWKLVGTNTGVSNTRLGIVKTQGVHLADSTWATVPTGTQDRLLVIIDRVWGYTVQCADVVPDMAARTWTASNCGIMWHSSNGLDYNNPLSDDQRNFTSRGRIPDAMQVPASELAAAKAAGTGLGHVMHLFFVGTCGADGHVHPMTNEENKPCWTGPVPGDNNDGGWGAEGTRLRIKPSVDLVARGLTGEALVIARTLQQNGTYIGDNSGSASQLKLGPPEDYQGTNLTTDVFKDKLDWTKDFEVVQPGWQ